MVEKRSCCCGAFPKGLWWLITLLGLPLLYFFMFNANKDPIEADLTQRVGSTLESNNMSWATVNVDERGRDIILSGHAPTSEAGTHALALAQSVTGVRIAEANFTEVVATDDISLNISLVDGKVTLEGTVASQEEMDAIVKASVERVGEGNVNNQLLISNKVKSSTWLGSIAGLMGLVMEGGSLTASAEGVMLTGAVDSQGKQDTLLAKAKGLLSNFNIPLLNRITVNEPPPAVKEPVIEVAEVKEPEAPVEVAPEVKQAINVCQDKLNTTMEGKSVHFKTNASVIQQKSHELLNQVANVLNECNNEIASGVSINGHTDSRGNDAYNMALSLRRATAVKSYLEQHNVKSSLLKSVGHGETSPIASNDTRDGRAQNRRITFIINQ